MFELSRMIFWKSWEQVSGLRVLGLRVLGPGVLGSSELGVRWIERLGGKKRLEIEGNRR
jgi:hypothetical protein